MISRRIAAAFALVALFTACESEPTDIDAPQFNQVDAPSAMNRTLAGARAATARYHDVNAALQGGFVNSQHCVSVPGVGAMGIHFVNYGRIMDAGYDPAEPEALLYEPQDDGSLKLVGVEYVIVQEAWHGAGNVDLPRFAGQPFDAMPANAGAPATYTLHAWIWAANPAGMLTPFNPAVRCPAGGMQH